MTDRDVIAFFHSAMYLPWPDRQRWLQSDAWPPDLLDYCIIQTQVFIGSDPDPETDHDSFDVTICSPTSFTLAFDLANEDDDGFDPRDPVMGAAFWFMPSWDQLVFESAVKRLCAEASPGPDWPSVASRIGSLLPWEYSYRYEIRAERLSDSSRGLKRRYLM